MKWILQIVAVILAFTSCNRTYPVLLEEAKKQCKVPMEFEDLYGRDMVKSGISGSSYTSSGDVTFWSESACFSRYRLVFESRMNVAGSKIISAEPGSVTINEITEVIDHGSGRIEASFGKQWKISKDQWDAVYRARGDFNSAGIKLEENRPVKGFEKYVESNSLGK